VNRLLPQPALSTDFVNETVIGVPSRGHSTTSTQLSVRLFPATDQLRLGIEAAGLVDSDTASSAGVVTFFSHGQSNYRVGKLVVVDRTGIRVGPAMADANSRTRLDGMETDFDAVPLLRNVVRGYAMSQHDERQGQAQQEVEAKVASRATQRLDSEVNSRLINAQAELSRRFLNPLDHLDVERHVVQLKTTEERLLARLRIGGDDQLGAHTPRPLAMSNSLGSFQVHESAINNALERLQLAGRTYTLPQLHRWISDRLGRVPQVKLPDDLPEDVVVTFAEEEPLHVRFHEGRVEIQLTIAELDQGGRLWNDFGITAFYRPQRSGLRLEFVRDGAVELTGEGYTGRTEFVLRGIFAKVFSPRRKLVIEPQIGPDRPALANLEFSSAVVDNGWISVTLADRAGAAPKGGDSSASR
jgi:hypothetical protein